MKTKLATTLKAFSKQEWTSFKKQFLVHTNKDTNLYHLFDYYYKHRSSLDKLEEKDVQSHPKLRNLTAKGLSNLSSKLLQEVDRWLIRNDLFKENYHSNLLLVKALNRRAIYHRADQEAKKLESKIKNAKTLNLQQTDALAQLYHAQYYSNNPIKKTKENTLLQDCVFQFVQSTVERASLLRLEATNRSQIRNKSYDNEKEVLDRILALPSEKDTELTMVLKSAQDVLGNKNADAFFELKNYLEKGIINHSTDLELILISYLTRSAISMLNDKLISVNDFADVTQLKFNAIEKRSSYKLLPITFFNGIETLAFVLSYEETVIFIDKWKDKVHTKHPKSTESFALALNAFRHDMYEEIPELLNGLAFDDNSQKLISNALYIIAFYKLGEEALVVTLIQNFRNQVKRYQHSTISKRISEGLLNLVEIVHLLQKAKYDSSVSLNLNNYSTIYYKSWVEKEMKG